MECSADDREHVQVAGHGGFAEIFLRQGGDGEKCQQHRYQGQTIMHEGMLAAEVRGQ